MKIGKYNLSTYPVSLIGTNVSEEMVVRLYDLGHISSGQAAQLLDMSRWDFLDLLGRYHVSWFDDSADVVAEASYGQ